MLLAFKKFKNFEDMKKEIFISKSLEDSDLPRFLGEDVTDLESMQKRTEEVYQQSEEEKIWINFPEMSEWGFTYTTLSGRNSIEVYMDFDENNEFDGYFCNYYVDSSKPLEYSSIMKLFKEAGWICEDISRTPEEQEEFKKKYEEEMLEEFIQCLHEGKIPGINFGLSYKMIHNDNDSSKDFASIETTAIWCHTEEIEFLLERCPELSDEVIKVIDEQILEIGGVSVPTCYDYNGWIFEDSDYYVEYKAKVLKTLENIKTKILEKKLQERNNELGKLEKEQEEIAEIEGLIEKREKNHLGDKK